MARKCISTTLPANLLAAARLVAPRNEVRYYLNGAQIEVVQGQGTIVATDGHMLFAGRFFADPDTTDFSVIVPRDVLPGTTLRELRRHNKTIPYLFELRGEKARVCTLWRGDTGTAAREIEARYPDWRAVFPKEATGDEVAYFNPLYMAMLERISRVMGMQYPPPLLQNGRKGGIAFFDGGDALMMVMPLRVDAKPTKVPAWAVKPQEVKHAA